MARQVVCLATVRQRTESRLGEPCPESALYELVDDPRGGDGDADSDDETAVTTPTSPDTTPVDEDLRDRVERVLNDGEYAATPERAGAAVAVLETLRE